MTTMASKITSLTVVYSIVYSAQIKENIKAPRHWTLCGEFTGTGEFPAQRASNAENVSIWLRHYEVKSTARHVISSRGFVYVPQLCPMSYEAKDFIYLLQIRTKQLKMVETANVLQIYPTDKVLTTTPYNCLLSTKPMSEPTLNRCQLRVQEQFSVKFEANTKFSFMKISLKCCLLNDGYSVQT